MKNFWFILYSGILIFVLGISGYQFFQAQKQKATDEITQTSGPTTQTPTLTTTDSISYTFSNKKMFVTFNAGENWLEVPATMAEFFGGEYATASSNELLPNSYLLTKEQTGLIMTKENATTRKNDVIWLQTTDEGKSWQEYPIFKDFPAIRFRKIQFFKQIAYAFVSGGRVMGQEGFSLAVSSDQGKSWQTLAPSDLTSVGMLVQDAGFVTEKLGFLSRKDGLFVTQDGGNHWQKSQIQIPDNYKEIFLIAEIPYEKDGKLLMQMNQGDQGDYKGGLVKGIFQSSDEGLTWTFVAESEGN